MRVLSLIKRVFKRTKSLMNDNEELRLINEAFSALNNKKGYFDDMYRMYQARYDDSELRSLKENNYNFIYVPLVRNIINTIVGLFNTAFFSGKNPIEIRAVRAEDEKIINGVNRLIQYYYELCNPQTELLNAIRGALVYGFASVNIYWDKNKNKVVTKNIPIFQLALDPKAMNITDAQYVCVKTYNTFEYYKSIFGNKIKEFAPNNKYEMLELKEIYIYHLEGWEKKSYIKNTCIDKQSGLNRLPFCYGYALAKIAPDSENKLSNELMYFGDSLARLLAPMQSEMNKKRNLKLDIDESKINPKGVYTDGFPIEILQQGAGAVARVDLGGEFKPIVFGGDIDIGFDINLINKEAEEASGVNSIHMGRTNNSDRRSATSLAIINSSSSVRIEEMIATINKTLFEHWGKQFVDLVLKNAPLEIRAVLGTDLIAYNEITSILKINFGSSFASKERVNSLMQVLQILSQNPNINAKVLENILSEILTLELGDSYDVSEIFSNPNAQNLSKGVL